jgi:hypothetical protein
MSGLLHRPRYADVVGTLALLVAMSGTAYAAHALPKNSVGARQLKTGAVAGQDVKDGGVGAADLAAGSVGSTALSAGSVGSAALGDGSVGSSELAGDAVTGAKIKDDSVSLSDLVGVDSSFPISFSLGANGCGTLVLGVAGAEVGQVVLFSFTGDVAVPTSISIGGTKVTAADAIQVKVCNNSASSVSVSDLGIRVLTFG